MRDKIRAYINNLVMIREASKKQSIIEEQKGNEELMMLHIHRASTLKVVIDDLRLLVKEETNE